MTKISKGITAEDNEEIKYLEKKLLDILEPAYELIDIYQEKWQTIEDGGKVEEKVLFYNSIKTQFELTNIGRQLKRVADRLESDKVIDTFNRINRTLSSLVEVTSDNSR